MKRGSTQISTKVNNAYQGKALTLQSGVGGVQQEIYRQVYGPLLLADPMQPMSKAVDDIQFFQSLDLTQTYGPRSQPVLSTMLTAAVKNARNLFLPAVVSPVWETDELNFQVNRREWNNIEYTDLVEGGIADEPTFSSWGWTDKLKKKKQSVTVSMDLALDNTYGAAVWQENLAILASDALLSIMLEIAYAVVTIGYANLIEDRVRQIPFDLSRLYMAETAAFMVAALDQNRLFDLIREKEKDVEGLDLAIFPAMSMQFMREVEGESRTMEATVLSTNPETQQIQARIVDGPDSFKSVKVGDRFIDFVEMTGFTVNSRDPSREDPLVTKLTLCHAFPPNPDCRADAEVTNCSPKKLAMEVFYQTKEIGEDRWLDYKDCLKNMWYYDPRTRKVSVYVEDLLRRKNRKLGDDKAPWAFNSKMNRCAVQDVNDEDTEYGYEKPDVSTLKHQAKLAQMYSWRHDFFGLTWDPEGGEYKVPRRLGDFHRSALPDEWLAKASRTLVMAFEKETGYNMNQELARFYALMDNIDNAAVTWDYVQAFINTQMPYASETELKTNMYGSLRLPTDESGVLADMEFPPFFNSGRGLVTLARAADQPASNWQPAGKQAKPTVHFLYALQKFIARYIGATDGATAGDAIDKDLDRLVDTLYGHREPIFVGVPENATAQKADISLEAPTGKTIEDPLEFSVDTVMAAPINGRDKIIRNDGIRAYASLLPTTRVKDGLRALFAKVILGKDLTNKEETQRVFSLLFDFILEVSQFDSPQPRKNAEKAARIVSATTAEFVDLYKTGEKQDIKAAETFLTMMKNRNKSTEKVKEWETNANMYYNDPDTTTEIDVLKQAEKNFESAKVARKEGTSTQTDRIKEVNNTRAGAKAVYFEGVFMSNDKKQILRPTQWLSGAAVATAGLSQFIDVTEIKWIVPADPQHQYTRPLVDADMAVQRENQRKSCRLSRLGGASMLRSFATATQTGTAARPPSSASMSMRDLLHGEYDGEAMDFGRPIDERNFGGRSRGARHSWEDMQVERTGPDGKTQMVTEQQLKREFFGPWRSRLQFVNAMDSDAEQAFQLCLIQAPNTLDVHLKGADLGIKYFNVIIFRPFIELTARSVIVMKKGPDTMMTPMSRFDVMVSKEDRGIFHIGSSFYCGTVRANPQGIAMIPYCIPDRFIGGKNVTFMTAPEEWTVENPLKPSLVCLPIPVSESNFGSPIHMLNEETYLRPGIDLDNHYRKYSSWEFYQSIFSEKNTSMVEAMHAERQRYWQSVDISQVGHICCRTFLDEHSLERIEKEGVGPGCDRRMNMPGAEKTMNGQSTYFPQRTPTYNQRVRAM